MFDSFQRFKNAYENGQQIEILYLGDFDPSGMDMIRDIRDRTVEFINGYYPDDEVLLWSFSVTPIALTRLQIDQYNPPPNPAKRTDPRAKDFIEQHGTTSWEVDALPPNVLNTLLEDAIRAHIDEDMYNDIVSREDADKVKLESLYQYL